MDEEPVNQALERERHGLGMGAHDAATPAFKIFFYDFSHVLDLFCPDAIILSCPPPGEQRGNCQMNSKEVYEKCSGMHTRTERPRAFPKGDRLCDHGTEHWQQGRATTVRNIVNKGVRLRCGTGE